MDKPWAMSRHLWFELLEVRDEVQSLINKLEPLHDGKADDTAPIPSNDDMAVYVAHIYDHLNRMWNGRALREEDLRPWSSEISESLGEFPVDLHKHLMSSLIRDNRRSAEE
jgi:hypothetical protein